MQDRIELPAEFAHLIEKREQADRRAAEKAKAAGAPSSEQPPAAPAKERRRGKDRRGS